MASGVQEKIASHHSTPVSEEAEEEKEINEGVRDEEEEMNGARQIKVTENQRKVGGLITFAENVSCIWMSNSCSQKRPLHAGGASIEYTVRLTAPGRQSNSKL